MTGHGMRARQCRVNLARATQFSIARCRPARFAPGAALAKLGEGRAARGNRRHQNRRPVCGIGSLRFAALGICGSLRLDEHRQQRKLTAAVNAVALASTVPLHSPSFAR